MLKSALEYDDDGKIVMDNIYNRPDPRSYFSTLEHLDYIIPAEAEPVFRKMIEARRADRDVSALSVLDLGCSYGVNAAILKHGLTMDDLYQRYAHGDAGGLDRGAMLASDRDFYADHIADPDLDMTGLDVAARAIDYAVEGNILDGGLVADLESGAPEAAVRKALAGTDLVISTGCVGYVTGRTLGAVIEASEGQPWMAHFVLRMFPADAFEDMYAEHGYVTETLPGTFRQRRFASEEERTHVLQNLAALGIDATGREAEGWYHAEFRLSRPAADAKAMPLQDMFRH